MRNKFSELVDAGVAEFKYINTVTDTTDPICREYNNLYSLYTDTHMNPYKGGYIITGNIKAPEYNPSYATVSGKKFDYVLSTCATGINKGYPSIYYFFNAHNLRGQYEKVNNDDAYVLTFNEPAEIGSYHICTREEIEQAAQTVRDEECEMSCPNHYYECDSSIPHPIYELTSTGDINKILECFQSKNIGDITKRLNESPYIKGNYYQYNGDIYGYVNNKNIKL